MSGSQTVSIKFIEQICGPKLWAQVCAVRRQNVADKLSRLADAYGEGPDRFREVYEEMKLTEEEVDEMSDLAQEHFLEWEPAPNGAGPAPLG